MWTPRKIPRMRLMSTTWWRTPPWYEAQWGRPWVIWALCRGGGRIHARLPSTAYTLERRVLLKDFSDHVFVGARNLQGFHSPLRFLA
jgi:hypothetical protein